MKITITVILDDLNSLQDVRLLAKMKDLGWHDQPEDEDGRTFVQIIGEVDKSNLGSLLSEVHRYVRRP